MTRSNSSYDVFISYRRDGGAETAKHLRDVLTERGYSVFFDTDSLRSGNFNSALYGVIDGCTDFIMVLSPGSLDRCVDPNDWVRQELAYALARGKNVIPLMSRGFRFPNYLPPDIEAVRWKNGIEVNVEYFDAMIDRLTTFMQSRPAKKVHPAVLVAGALACLALGALLGFLMFGGWRGSDAQQSTGSGQTEQTQSGTQTQTRAKNETVGYTLGEMFEICNPSTGEVEYLISVDGVHILAEEFQSNMWEDYDPEVYDLLAVQCTVENYGYHRGSEGQVQLYQILQDNTIIVKDSDGFQLNAVESIYHGNDGPYVCEITSSVPVDSKGRFCFIFYVEHGTAEVTVSLDSHAGTVATMQAELQ